ncbi:MAG: putative membrane protein [Paraglaciecola sp.]|jgi:uncharacterized membrane protein
MTKTRLYAALSLALLIAPVSQAAKYRVVELPVADKGQSSFPSAINEDGNITVIVGAPQTNTTRLSTVYNIPIDLDLLDFESDTLINGLTDVASASNGDFNSTDYELLLALIRASDGAQSAQQIADTIGFLATENETSYIPGFDQRSTPDNAFSISTNSILRDVNNSGFTVGSGEGFYNKIDYTVESGEDVTFVVHEFGTRGFVGLGGEAVVGLPAPETIAGGFSDAFGINENNQVVGYGTSLFSSDTLQTAITDCRNDELVDDEDPDTQDFPLRGDFPVESCISSIVDSLTSSPATFSQLRGLIWQLDAQGNLLDTKELGILFEPEADDTTNYSSQAFAINDNGIAVGISNGEYTENGVTVIRNFGVIFDQDEVINLSPEPDSAVARSSRTISSANDINNDNLVVGYQFKSVNGSNRTKFFVYDMNLDTFTFPDDFFLGSSSVALDINNNGLVVGYGEVDASLTGRRTEGFLYDYAAKQFFAARDLISCDSPYTIVQANSINDMGEIGATALYQGPLKDSRGEPILDSTGSEIIADLVMAVKLEPITGGELGNCDALDDDVNRDRQGASVSWLFVFGLAILGWRRFKNRL